MTDQSHIESERTLESVFDHAVIRPEPPRELEQEVRSAVAAEWRSGIKRRQRRTVVNWALAASVVVAAYLGFDLLRSSPSAPPQIVAQVDMSQGPVIVADEATSHTPTTGTTLLSGQTVRTPGNAALSLAWTTGGSLRIGAGSRVRLVGIDEIELQDGRLYFDSAGSRPSSALRVVTREGVLQHVGTQYMATVSRDRVTVRVREGRVLVSRSGQADLPVEDGRVELVGNGVYRQFAEASYGDSWDWVAEAAPERSFNGRRIIEFLRWVARETGREVHFESRSLEELATRETIVWPAVLRPTEDTLVSVLSTTDLRSDLVGKRIVIRAAY